MIVHSKMFCHRTPWKIRIHRSWHGFGFVEGGAMDSIHRTESSKSTSISVASWRHMYTRRDTNAAQPTILCPTIHQRPRPGSTQTKTVATTTTTSTSTTTPLPCHEPILKRLRLHVPYQANAHNGCCSLCHPSLGGDCIR